MPGKRMSKSQFVATLAEKSGITKKQAAAALKTMNEMVAHQLGRHGPGEILIPGTHEAERGHQARHPRAPGHQSLYQGTDHLQGQAGPQDRPRQALEGAQRRHLGRAGLAPQDLIG